MKKINLVSGTNFINENHFFVDNTVFGKEVVVLRITEEEFKNRSVAIKPYAKDLVELPMTTITCASAKVKDYICEAERDFNIAVDKGTIGLESMPFIFRAHIAETDDEFVISIAAEINEETAQKLINKMYNENGYTVRLAVAEHLVKDLNDRQSSDNVQAVIMHMNETPFIDLANGRISTAVQIDSEGKFRFKDVDLSAVENDSGEIKVGDYVYRKLATGGDILEVEHFAHDAYADFYAVLKTVYILPSDMTAAKEKFPKFFEQNFQS